MEKTQEKNLKKFCGGKLSLLSVQLMTHPFPHQPLPPHPHSNYPSPSSFSLFSISLLRTWTSPPYIRDGRIFYPTELTMKHTSNSTSFSTSCVFSVLPKIASSLGFSLCFVLSNSTSPPTPSPANTSTLYQRHHPHRRPVACHWVWYWAKPRVQRPIWKPHQHRPQQHFSCVSVEFFFVFVV